MNIFIFLLILIIVLAIVNFTLTVAFLKHVKLLHKRVDTCVQLVLHQQSLDNVVVSQDLTVELPHAYKHFDDRWEDFLSDVRKRERERKNYGGLRKHLSDD
jgi:hypothetical protein